MQEIKADTTTTGVGDSDTRTSSASVTVPTEWAYASVFIGFVFLILGFAIPDRLRKSDLKKDSYEKIVESKEDIEVGDGNKRKIVRERTERHRGRKDENDN
ncbi:MAG: hypothetical protein AABY05_00795, partial [Nanoarchaeota archaeon]